MFLVASPAISQPDVMMRDCVNDNGDIVAPGYTCGSIYMSPDVWLRLNPDYGTADEAPIAGDPAYVHVSLYNRGNAASACGVLCVYFRDMGTGLTDWPTHWLNYAPGGIIRGDAVGKIDVCAMQPGETRTVIVPWASVPSNIYTGHHHCLLVRWISADDPMQTPEGSNMYVNVFGNNNIVHRNCQPTRPASPSTPVSVHNTKEEGINTQLKFTAERNENGKTIFDDIKDFSIKITMDAETYNKWDGKGENIEKVDGENAVRITGADATIDDLPIPAATQDAIGEAIVDVANEFPADIPADADKMYVWTMEQHNSYTQAELNQFADEGHPAPVDGVGFLIYTSDEDNGDGAARRNVAPTVSPNTVRPELTAHPNIMKGSTDIYYSLQQSATVTLIISDISGRPVRTLLAGSEAAAGNHQIEWDGKAADGSLVPGGTYFYRLVTPEGAVEHQLRIVR